MIHDDLLKQALTERRARQAANEQEEFRRRALVLDKCPQVGQLMQERQRAITQGLLRALDGHDPGSILEDTQRRNEQIARLMMEAGFEPGFLDPLHDCALCRDSGYAGEEVKGLCRCVVDRYHQLLQGDAFLSTDQTFESYDERVYPASPLPGETVSQRAYTRVLRNQCEKYADSVPGGELQNLLLYGGSGLGKTFLLQAIGARAASRGVQTLAYTANTLLNQIRRIYFAREEVEEPAYMSVPLLLIDDLGTEPLWENITVEQLFALIDHRLRQGLHTVISTNLNLTELKLRYTERIMSRLLDVRRSQKLAFLGQDIRLNESQR